MWYCSQCGHIHTHTQKKRRVGSTRGNRQRFLATAYATNHENSVCKNTDTHIFNKNTSTHVHTHALPLFLFTLISNRKSAIALHHAPFVIACRSLLLLLFFFSSFNQYNASDSSFCLLFLGLRRQRFLALLHCIVQSIIPPILRKAADHQS